MFTTKIKGKIIENNNNDMYNIVYTIYKGRRIKWNIKSNNKTKS